MAKARATGRPVAKGGGNGRWIAIVVGVAVVGLAVGIAVLTAGEAGTAGPSVSDLAGEVVVEGDGLGQFPGDAATDPARGRPSPVISGAGYDGSPVTIGEPGRPQVVTFMASWCPACQQELPEIVSWMQAGGVPDGVEFVVVSTSLDDRRPNWPPDEWLESEGYDGPVIVDDAQGSIARAAGMSATPFWLVLDGQGTVVLRLAGMLGEEQLDELVALVG